GHHLVRLRQTDSVLLGQVRCGEHGVLTRGVGLQLERAPRHLDLVGVLVVSQRLLETRLADVAPGAGDIGPDLDLHASDLIASGARPTCDAMPSERMPACPTARRQPRPPTTSRGPDAGPDCAR